MYISNYLFNKYQEKQDIEIPNGIYKILNKIFPSQNISNIEDLSLKQINELFNNLINIKFNETKRGLEGGRLENESYMHTIYSLAKASGVSDDTKLSDLFKKELDKEKLQQTEKK